MSELSSRESRYFAIYPDYWKETWGEKPLLGVVVAENDFHAQRRAYDRNFLRVNFTFGPEAVEITEKQAESMREALHKRYRRYRY